MRYKCTVSYNGSTYEGWQTQKKGNSIQEEIENALFQLTHEHIRITVAGRTDAKVNAYGQVFHFDSDLDMPERKWKGGINTFLSDQIYIREVEKVDARFHARYCVEEKQYDYRINLGETSVFNQTYTYQCPYKVNVKKMKEASTYLIGTHDFTAFCSNSKRETPDQVRTVRDIQFHKEGDILTISFYGRGFLRYMVRMMSAQLLEVGRGRIEPIEIKHILEAKSKTRNRKNARPEGLTLMHIQYFTLLAFNEDVMIRSFLQEDTYPMGWTYKKTKNAEMIQRYPRIYHFVTRAKQKSLGYLKITKNSCTLYVYSKQAERYAQQLLAMWNQFEPQPYTIKRTKG